MSFRAALCTLLLIGGGFAGPAFVTAAHAQSGPPPDLLYRIERLEAQLRQMTGEIEQLQYRNQQLEAAINALRSPDAGGRGGPPRVATTAPPPPPASGPPPMGPPTQMGPPPTPVYGNNGRHADAFDPNVNPNAPGVPRTLGSVPLQPPPPNTRPGMAPTPYATPDDQAYGPPPGAPPPSGPPMSGPPNSGPPPSDPPPTSVATAPPPGASARDTYNAGIGSLQHHDFAAAEEAFRDFVNRFPNDRMVGDAQYYLGESLYQRQSYQEAAAIFVQVAKKYENSTKAPDALLRLGQTLAAMNETALACEAFADVGRKYPRASAALKQAVDREQKRARCT